MLLPKRYLAELKGQGNPVSLCNALLRRHILCGVVATFCNESAMQLPSFSYSISRPYPYRWFTWVVIAGGICATIFLSILNLAANGYILQVQYYTDYNGTMMDKRWTQRLPFSLLDKTTTTCQSKDIPVNSQFFTDKLALPYSLTAVWKRGQGDSTNVSLASLEYRQRPLENCLVAFIQVDLESTERSAAEQGYGAWGPKAFAQVTCSIYDPGVTWFNFTVSYEFVTPTIETGEAYRFLQQPNNKTQASLWWGQSLLSWYWMNLAAAMEKQESIQDGYVITKGSISLRPSTVTDMADLDFFTEPGYHFTRESYDSNSDLHGRPLCCINPAEYNRSNTIGGLAQEAAVPNIWLEADSFAKSFYTTIMADLGQASNASLLQNAILLQHFTSNITTMRGYNASTSVETPWLQAGPARQTYNDAQRSTGPLKVTGPSHLASVIYAQYFCQVPILKSRGALFVAVLVADLVLLQALWKILNWSTLLWLERSDPHANVSSGCLKASDRGIELASRDPATTTTLISLGRGVKARSYVSAREAGRVSSESHQRLVSPLADTGCRADSR